MPPDAMLSWPGCALAYSMNSGTVFTGSDGVTSMTSGVIVLQAIGAMSWMKSYGSFL